MPTQPAESIISSITDGEIIHWLSALCGIILTAGAGAFGYVFKTSMKTIGTMDRHLNEIKGIINLYEERFIEMKKDEQRIESRIDDHEMRLRRLEGR